MTIPRVGDLGRNLSAARKKLGLTQEEVGHRSGVHPTEVSRIEAGKRDPRVRPWNDWRRRWRSLLASCCGKSFAEVVGPFPHAADTLFL